jgi:hypothetical protein
LTNGGGEHHGVRRALVLVLTLLVGFGIGVLASEGGGFRSSDCQTASPPFGELVAPFERDPAPIVGRP